MIRGILYYLAFLLLVGLVLLLCGYSIKTILTAAGIILLASVGLLAVISAAFSRLTHEENHDDY